MGNFVFNGVSAADMGLTVERFPVQQAPRKRLTAITIPGRSGVLHQWDGAFDNFTQRYICWFKASPVAGQAHKIKEWLLSAPAAARLEDTYDSTVYHQATYTGPMDIENVLDRFGRCTIEFDCAAPAYLKSGETALRITSGGFINNPTPWPSRPLIVVTCNNSIGGVVHIGSREVSVLFNNMQTDTLYIDCDIREAWEIVDGVEVPTPASIGSPEYPVIEPGRNDITITGIGIEAVTVYPRWWTL